MHAALMSAALHATTLGVRMGFILLLLRSSSATTLGHYGLLASIELIAIYLAGLELHTFTTRRYAMRPSPLRLRFSLACHRKLLNLAVPAVCVGVWIATLALEIPLDSLSRLSFSLAVAAGAISQEIGRFLVLTFKPTQSVLLGFIRSTSWMLFISPFLGASNDPLMLIVYGWTIASLSASALGVWLMKDAMGFGLVVRLAYLRHALADAAKYSLVALSSIAQGNVERFVLQTMLGPSAVGLLAFFQTLANTIPAILQAGVINIALPKVLHLHGRGLSDRWRFLAKFSAVCAVVSVLMALVIYVAADPVAQFARHAELRGQQHILAILLAVQIVMMTSQPIHLAAYAARIDAILVGSSLLIILVSVVATVASVHMFGLIGAPIATGISAACMFLARAIMLRKLLRL